ncbi:hypothetical protein MMC14_008368 [Varicellaria rhodocarpa]|nr:hypothetical protein [Varicellaria rhodocarpa]
MPRVVREELHVSDIESDSDDELEQELAKLRKALAPREVQTRPATVRPSPATAVDAGPSPQPESGEEPERHHPNHARLQDRLDHLVWAS